MLSETALVFSTLLAISFSKEDLLFPPGFKFGVASAAYQVEGAWNVSDKGESIWDRFTHTTPSPIYDGSSGDVACDSYHLWKEDIRLVAEVGADFYRISISWARLLPNGHSDYISADGKKYYSDLIDGLLEKGIEPVVTIYHWDLPQNLQNLGGWTNPLIVDWFADYAREVFSLYGSRVKTWITINEPWSICDIPYLTGIFAPGTVSQVGAYVCTKNVLMAHAKAWRIYDEEFRHIYQGQVSFANHPIWIEAATEADEDTAEIMREFQGGRFTHAIFSKEGGWPPAVQKAIADYSLKEGLSRSMLPELTKEEIVFMKGTYDFYGLNFYNTRRVHRAKEGEELKPWPFADAPMVNAKLDYHPDWPLIMQYYPEGLRKQLVWLKNHYGNIPFLITELGLGSGGGLADQERIDYYKDYLKQVMLTAFRESFSHLAVGFAHCVYLDPVSSLELVYLPQLLPVLQVLLAIKEDGVNVTGFTAWTLMDNFEWAAGYAARYGLYDVDFTSPNRTRTARNSARYFTSIARSRSLDVPVNFVSV